MPIGFYILRYNLNQTFITNERCYRSDLRAILLMGFVRNEIAISEWNALWEHLFWLTERDSLWDLLDLNFWTIRASLPWLFPESHLACHSQVLECKTSQHLKNVGKKGAEGRFFACGDRGTSSIIWKQFQQNTTYSSVHGYPAGQGGLYWVPLALLPPTVPHNVRDLGLCETKHHWWVFWSQY